MKYLIQSFALYLCTGLLEFQFLAKVVATNAGSLPKSLLRNDAVAEMCSGKFSGT
jgi:hypothetical protein